MGGASRTFFVLWMGIGFSLQRQVSLKQTARPPAPAQRPPIVERRAPGRSPHFAYPSWYIRMFLRSLWRPAAGCGSLVCVTVSRLSQKTVPNFGPSRFAFGSSAFFGALLPTPRTEGSENVHGRSLRRLVRLPRSVCVCTRYFTEIPASHTETQTHRHMRSLVSVPARAAAIVLVMHPRMRRPKRTAAMTGTGCCRTSADSSASLHTSAVENPRIMPNAHVPMVPVRAPRARSLDVLQ